MKVLLIGSEGVLECELEDIEVLAAMGYIEHMGNDIYEVTDAGRAYVARERGLNA